MTNIKDLSESVDIVSHMERILVDELNNSITNSILNKIGRLSEIKNSRDTIISTWRKYKISKIKEKIESGDI